MNLCSWARPHDAGALLVMDAREPGKFRGIGSKDGRCAMEQGRLLVQMAHALMILCHAVNASSHKSATVLLLLEVLPKY